MKMTIVNVLKWRADNLSVLLVSLFCFVLLGPRPQLFAQTGSDVKNGETVEAGEVDGNGPNRLVVKVNGVGIMQREVDAELDKLIPRTFIHNRAKKRKRKKMTEDAIKKLIEEELIYQEAIAVGVGAPEDKIDKEIENRRERVRKYAKVKKTEDSLEKLLKRSNLNMDWLRYNIKKMLTVPIFQDIMKKKFSEDAESLVTDEYAKAYYKENMEQFVEPETIHLLEIRLKVDPGSYSDVWKKTEKKAREIKERLLKGEDFSSLAKEFSDDSYAKKGGDMGFLHKGSMMAEIDNAIEDMNAGDIGGPIRSLYGYHILKVLERKPATQKSFEDVKDWLKRGLKIRAERRLYKEWLKGIKEKADIEYPKGEKEIKKNNK